MCSENSTSDYGVHSIGKSVIQYALTIVVPGRIFLIYYKGLKLHRPRSWHESCWFLTCRRREVNQLYCPKYWEFSKHVKCSDFLCTINDLDFVVFVLYYMVIPLSGCKLMPLDLFPRFRCLGFSGPGGRWQLKKRVRVPGIDLQFPSPA